MKKIIISALAILMISAFALPASAASINHDINIDTSRIEQLAKRDIIGDKDTPSSIDKLNSGYNINRAADKESAI